MKLNKIILIFVFLILISPLVNAATKINQENPIFTYIFSKDKQVFEYLPLTQSVGQSITSSVISIKEKPSPTPDDSKYLNVVESEIYKDSPGLVYTLRKFVDFKKKISSNLPPSGVITKTTILGSGKMSILVSFDAKSPSPLFMPFIDIAPYSFWTIDSMKFTPPNSEFKLVRIQSKLDGKPISSKDVTSASLLTAWGKCKLPGIPVLTIEDVCRENKMCTTSFADLYKLSRVGSCDELTIFETIKINLGNNGGDVVFNTDYSSIIKPFTTNFKINGIGTLKVGELNYPDISKNKNSPAEFKIRTQPKTQQVKKRTDTITYAHFISAIANTKYSRTYKFYYNNKEFIYKVEPANEAEILFDPPKGISINGKGEINFDNRIILSNDKSATNIVFDNSGNIVRIDYSAGGAYSGNENEFERIEATSASAFSICFKSAECKGKTTYLIIDKKDGFNVLTSKGKLKYSVGSTEVEGITADAETILIQSLGENRISVRSGIAVTRKDRIESEVDATKNCCPGSNIITGAAYQVFDSRNYIKKECGTQVKITRTSVPTLPTGINYIIDRCMITKDTSAMQYVIGSHGEILGSSNAKVVGKDISTVLTGTFDIEKQKAEIKEGIGAGGVLPFGSRELTMIPIINALVNGLNKYKTEIDPRNNKVTSLINQLNLIEIVNKPPFSNRGRSLEQQRVDAMTTIGVRADNLNSVKKLISEGYPFRSAVKQIGLSDSFSNGFEIAINEDGSFNLFGISEAAKSFGIEADKQDNIIVAMGLLENVEILLDVASIQLAEECGLINDPIVGVVTSSEAHKGDIKTIIDSIETILKNPSLFLEENPDPEIEKQMQKYNSKLREYYKTSYSNKDIGRFKSDFEKELYKLRGIYNTRSKEFDVISDTRGFILNKLAWNKIVVFGYEFFSVVDIIPIGKAFKLAKAVEKAGGVRAVAKLGYARGFEYLDNLIKNADEFFRLRPAGVLATVGVESERVGIIKTELREGGPVLAKMEEHIPGAGNNFNIPPRTLPKVTPIPPKTPPPSLGSFTSKVGIKNDEIPNLIKLSKMNDNNYKIFDNYFADLNSRYIEGNLKEFNEILNSLETNIIDKLPKEARTIYMEEINLLKDVGIYYDLEKIALTSVDEANTKLKTIKTNTLIKEAETLAPRERYIGVYSSSARAAGPSAVKSPDVVNFYRKGKRLNLNKITDSTLLQREIYSFFIGKREIKMAKQFTELRKLSSFGPVSGKGIAFKIKDKLYFLVIDSPEKSIIYSLGDINDIGYLNSLF